jgi:signal transduction histidine kinase
VGIPSSNLSKLYDPFFTTKLGRGGSGLGMNIVYNIINGVLGGKISIASTVGSGVQVEIIIPQNAPGSLNQGVDRDE